ncbi:MAG: acyl carrier protein [Planctomycetes bacterium]|nr:acyl carrier protein [Planctomycetota bacterium]
MKAADVESRVVDILRIVEGLPVGPITRATSIAEIEGDSLDCVEILMELEDEFPIEDIPDEIAEGWKTVGDVVDYVTARL